MFAYRKLVARMHHTVHGKCETGRNAHHGHPAQSGDALAHSRQVVEQAAATLLLPEILDLLDLVREGSEEVGHLCLIGKNSRKAINQKLRLLCGTSNSKSYQTVRVMHKTDQSY